MILFTYFYLHLKQRYPFQPCQNSNRNWYELFELSHKFILSSGDDGGSWTMIFIPIYIQIETCCNFSPLQDTLPLTLMQPWYLLQTSSSPSSLRYLMEEYAATCNMGINSPTTFTWRRPFITPSHQALPQCRCRSPPRKCHNGHLLS